MVVVCSPAWFSSSYDPKERKKQILSFIALSIPGPHAFLLCVPANQPADGEAKALDVLNQLFGQTAVSTHTIILFTHTDDLEEDESLEEYLVTWRKDLQELVGRCGDRYHTLEPLGRELEEGAAVRDLLEKVEMIVEESGVQHFTCPLYQKVEERVKARNAIMSPEEELTEQEMEAVWEEVEQNIDHLNLDVDGLFPPARILPPSPVPPFLQGCWGKLTGWLSCLPTFVRREALLGALVGLFMGGPLGGMIGAAVGSVATEVKRRRTQKTK